MIEKLDSVYVGDISRLNAYEKKLNEVIDAVNKHEALITARFESINGSVTMYDQATGDKIAETFARDSPPDEDMLDWTLNNLSNLDIRRGGHVAEIDIRIEGSDMKTIQGSSLRDCIRKAMEEDNENGLV
jgi:hypothetical protein